MFVPFFENWFEMAEAQLDDKSRLAFYDMIMRYAFAGKVPRDPRETGSTNPVDGMLWFAFMAIRPNIDKHAARVVAGRNGGLANRLPDSKTQANAKQNASKRKANGKQTESKREANAKQTESKREANAKQTESKREANAKLEERRGEGEGEGKGECDAHTRAGVCEDHTSLPTSVAENDTRAGVCEDHTSLPTSVAENDAHAAGPALKYCPTADEICEWVKKSGRYRADNMPTPEFVTEFVEAMDAGADIKTGQWVSSTRAGGLLGVGGWVREIASWWRQETKNKKNCCARISDNMHEFSARGLGGVEQDPLAIV